MVSGRRAVGALRAGVVRGGAALVATAALVSLTGTAAVAADVVMEPTSAPRGAGIMLSFALPQERPAAYTTQVQLDLPADLPIAEVYPMSVDDWAPRITNRTLAEPLPALHGGMMTDVTESIVWQRVAAAPVATDPVRLSVSIGPLPDADRVDFTLTQTYSDGTVVRWGGPDGQRPGPVLTLTAADPAAAAGHGGHSGGQPGGTTDAAAAPPADPSGGGTGWALMLAGLAGGTLLGAVGVWWRGRRSTTAAGSGDDADQLVGAGASGWRLTD